MRMSRPDPKLRTESETGFSLLEMLIVLTIMALMLSLIGSRSVTAIESTRFAQTADAGIGSLKLLRVEAMLDNRPLLILGSNIADAQTLPNGRIRQLSLPEGWVVSGDNILISKTGICSGGQITLQGPSNRRATYKMSPPLCNPVRVATIPRPKSRASTPYR